MKNKRAQTFVVYAALTVIIVAAIIAISAYLARSVQGKYRDTADVFGGGAQYEKGTTTVQEH